MLRKPHWPPAAWSEGRAGLKGQHPPEDVPGSCLRTTAIISCPHCVSVPGWQSKPPTLFPSLSPDVWAAGLGAGMARRNPSGRGHRTAGSHSQPFHRKAGCPRCAGGTSELALAKCPRWGRRVKLNIQIWQRKLPRLPEQ